MSDTTYVDYTTPTVDAAWLNEINDHVWHDTPVAGSTVHDAKLVGFTPSGTGAVARTAQDKMRESISVKDFGAVGDGITDDSAAEDKAHTEANGQAVSYPYMGGETYLGMDAGYNLYGNSAFTKALSEKVQAGLYTTPETTGAPVLWLQKFGNATRDTIPNNWDQGAVYSALIKKGGNAPGVAATFYGLHQGAEDASIIGLHGRVKLQSSNAGSDAWAGWLYTDVDVEELTAAHGLEINGYINPTLSNFVPYGGTLQLLRLVMADSASDNNRFSTALSIGRNTVGGTNNGVWTGIHVEGGAVVSSSVDTDDGEAFRVDGPIYGGQKIGGVRLVSGAGGTLGTFRYGLRTDEATFANSNAILLGTSQRVRWGNRTTGVYLSAGSQSLTLSGGDSGSFLNIVAPVSDTAIQVASIKVLGARKTGWAAATGTATRTTFATDSVTLIELARRVKALTDDLISHGLIGA